MTAAAASLSSGAAEKATLLLPDNPDLCTAMTSVPGSLSDTNTRTGVRQVAEAITNA